MRIGVIGPGAVGGYFGGLLAQAGQDVTFLARPLRAESLHRDGLVIKSVYGDVRVQPQVTTEARDLDGCEVILITLKNYHLDAAWKDIVKAMAKGAMALPLQNGVVHIDRFRAAFGAEHVLGGSCYIETTLDANGHILQTSEVRDIVYGPLLDPEQRGQGFNQVLSRLQDAFTAAGIPAFCREPILREMWKKYVFLCAFSGVTAATRSAIGVALDNQESAALYVGLVEELLAVARAHGIGLADRMREALLERALTLDPLMTSSLHRDLEKGSPLELDSLQGALVEMAEAAKVPVPWHKAVCAVLAPHREGAVKHMRPLSSP